jgi:diguanylate cyclase (GGDEF)-like protein
VSSLKTDVHDRRIAVSGSSDEIRGLSIAIDRRRTDIARSLLNTIQMLEHLKAKPEFKHITEFREIGDGIKDVSGKFMSFSYDVERFLRLNKALEVDIIVRKLRDRRSRDERRAVDIDPDTQLLVRNRFIQSVVSFLCKSKERRSSDSPFHALWFADVKRLKRINDTQGHRAGNDVIAQLASFVKSYICSEGGGNLHGRGGKRSDEFFGFTPCLSNLDDVVAIAHRFQNAIRAHEWSQYFQKPGPKPRVDVNVGVICWEEVDVSRKRRHIRQYVQHILEQADDLMYLMKQNKRLKGKFVYGKGVVNERRFTLLQKCER